ncbi:hypothetical protein P4637_11245 [Halalkalibacterium halodurans]|uniref:BH1110 protein n=2 Tax=Halalkalibacterium halodurans TaxID=86665 RepID=Q9KDV1_HALH5|nr:hypothetical protein [Halalkalibacterium halodurans]MDY7221643.1 hypothetical protein [Halalkalibacterium halodurans]MDY7240919.1 hypothetical protein [Halalkalibacterium halodurans]MED3645490.1 hypothetical protein [Halalkalibacterium halodurans]MED4079314.1 hypothetical protein [Halalkalibacterium halodurans]MED4085385.1 hypothetical protein [Halalkalibacterium halodurans]
MSFELLIPLAAIALPAVIVFIVFRHKAKELEMRQEWNPELEDLNDKMDIILQRLDAIEEQQRLMIRERKKEV